MHRMHVRMQR